MNIRWLRLCVLLIFSASGSALAADTWSTPFAGVRRLHRTTSSPKRNINVLVVDLTKPGVRLGATTSAQRRQKTSSFAKQVGAQAAINGDFFLYSNYSTRTLAVGQGKRWPGSEDNTRYGNVVFGLDNKVEIHQPRELLKFDASWMNGAVGGRPGIVLGGKVIDNSNYGTHCTYRPARTAVGLSKDKKTLYLVVVDYHSSSGFVGMTCNELGRLLQGLGAYTALSLDGGGSSSMYVAGSGVVNKPTGGVERVVANHLALFAPVGKSVGTLTGLVHKSGDPQQKLSGVTVTLGLSANDTTELDGVYHFKVPAGTYRLSASRVGYVTQEITRSVVANQTTSANIALVPGPAGQDSDRDRVPDIEDNCPSTLNADQRDQDGDGEGDACDADVDGDGVPDEDDNCPRTINPSQSDKNKDGKGDACEGGVDGGLTLPDGGTLPDDSDDAPESTDDDVFLPGDAPSVVDPDNLGEGELSITEPLTGGCSAAGPGALLPCLGALWLWRRRRDAAAQRER